MSGCYACCCTADWTQPPTSPLTLCFPRSHPSPLPPCISQRKLGSIMRVHSTPLEGAIFPSVPRSPSPGRGLRGPSKSHSAKRRRSRSVSSHSSGTSTTSSSSSYSSSQSGSSSRSSSGSETTSSHPSRSSQGASIQSNPGRQRYARALSEGLQPTDVAMDMEQSLSVDWAAVEAAGSLGALGIVRQGFQQLSLPVEPSQ